MNLESLISTPYYTHLPASYSSSVAESAAAMTCSIQSRGEDGAPKDLTSKLESSTSSRLAGAKREWLPGDSFSPIKAVLNQVSGSQCRATLCEWLFRQVLSAEGLRSATPAPPSCQGCRARSHRASTREPLRDGAKHKQPQAAHGSPMPMLHEEHSNTPTRFDSPIGARILLVGIGVR